MYGVASGGRGALSAAKRRRDRRLRCHWKHECLSVRMAVAANRHPSSGREGVEGETYDAPRRQKPPPPGSLPAPLSEVAGRQEVLVRHVVEHMADVCPVVQTLDVPVPQMVDTVLEFFRALDPPVDEQVISVPKISTDSVSQRLVERRLPQMVEQLVEVPTVLTPMRIALQIAEQIVDTPVEDDYGLLEYFCEDCVFLEMRCNEWQSWGHGVARLLRHSNGFVIFQFWQDEQLIVDDIVQRVGCPRLVLRPGPSGRFWAWSDPEFIGGPSEYVHAVRFASQELARRFHDEWAVTG